MKILHVLATDHPMPHAVGIILGLQAQGFDQTVILPQTSKHCRELEKANVKTRTKCLAWSDRVKRFFLPFLIRQEIPDAIHCWTAYGAAWLGDANRKGRKLPLITGWFGASADPDQFEEMDYLIGASRKGVSRAQRNGAEKKILFIPKPPEILAQAPIDRASLATSRDAKTMLVFARALPSRDVTFLLKALEKAPQWIAWFSGSGVWRHEVENQARRMGLIDRVRFVKKYKDRASLLRAVDLCLLPSRNDPFATCVFEAWATGTPVIACEGTEAAGLIVQNTTGILVQSGNADSLADACSRIIQNESLRRSLIAQGYAAYIKNYTRESVLLQWAEFFRSLKEEKRKPSILAEPKARSAVESLMKVQEIRGNALLIDHPTTGIFVPGVSKVLPL